MNSVRRCAQSIVFIFIGRRVRSTRCVLSSSPMTALWRSMAMVVALISVKPHAFRSHLPRCYTSSPKLFERCKRTWRRMPRSTKRWRSCAPGKKARRSKSRSSWKRSVGIHLWLIAATQRHSQIDFQTVPGGWFRECMRAL